MALYAHCSKCATSVMLWSGVEVMDVAPYVYDAAKPQGCIMSAP